MLKIHFEKNNGFRFYLICGVVSVLAMAPALSSAITGFIPYGYYITGGPTFGYMRAFNMDVDGSPSERLLVRKEASRQGSGVMFGVGYSMLRNPFRFSLEYNSRATLTYSEPKITTSFFRQQTMRSHLSVNTLVANGFYDFHFFNRNSPLIAFLKAGVGYARTAVKSYVNYTLPSGNEQQVERRLGNALVENLGAGVRYRVTPNFYLSLTGQFVNISEVPWAKWTDNGGSPIETMTMKANQLQAVEGIFALEVFFGSQKQPAPSLIGEGGGDGSSPALINDDEREDTLI